MQKCHFRPYSPSQTVLFSQRIDKDIAEDGSVRFVSGIIEGFDLGSLCKLYKERAFRNSIFRLENLYNTLMTTTSSVPWGGT